MELKYITDNISNDSIGKLVTKIKALKPQIDSEAVDLFDIKNHDVMIDQLGKRPKRSVTRTAYDANGKPILRADGSKSTTTTTEEVNRIPLPVQEYIVEQRTNMILANPLEIDAAPVSETDKNLVEVLKLSWKKNKLDFLLKEILTRQMSETEVAVIVYKEEAEEGYWDGSPNQGKKEKIRISVISSNGGNALYPVYDRHNDLVAFMYSYKLKDDETDKIIEYFDLLTAEKNYYYKQDGIIWSLEKTTVNIDKKIPCVYFYQDKVESYNVQPIIARREKLGSNHGDTNDYTGSPITIVTAESIESLPEKDESGKVIQLTGKDADAKYLESQGAPESIKMEYDNLAENGYMFSGTIDFSSLQKFFGSAPSGYAIKLLYQVAHLAASKKEGNFGKGIQRLLNLMKSLLCAINTSLKPSKNLNLEPVFNYYLPSNEVEETELLIKAKEAGLISEETAVIKCTLTKDGAEELKKIKKEKEAKAKLVPPAPVIEMGSPKPAAEQ